MKNREKYREEIAVAIKDGETANEKLCRFLKDNVIPRFVPEMEEGACGCLYCHTCTKMFTFWLDEEYVEPLKPEVDWNKVPVDTLVRVRDDEDDEWVPRYFVGIDENHKGRYVVWAGGATSKTSRGSTMHWMHCELVEDEDE